MLQFHCYTSLSLLSSPLPPLSLSPPLSLLQKQQEHQDGETAEEDP